MTDQNITQLKNQDMPEDEAKTKTTSTVTDNTTGAGKSLRWLYLAVAALFAIVLWQWQSSKQLHDQYEMLQHSVVKNVRQHTANKPLLQQLDATIANQQDASKQLQSLQEQANIAQNKLTNLQRLTLRESREDWILLEAEYRVDLASLKLNLEDDPKTAARLLAVVDERLAMLGDSSLNPIRQALSDDLLALRSLPIRDVEGALLKLQSLSNELALLPFLDTVAAEFAGAGDVADSQDANSTEQGTAGWRQNFANSLARLAEMVRIRKRETPLGPLFSPNQERLIAQNMQLMLSEAQLAMLQGRATVYKSKLAQVQQWLEVYFAADNRAVRAFDQQLTALEKFDFTPYPTDLSKSVAAIKALVHEHFSAPIEKEQQPSTNPTKDERA